MNNPIQISIVMPGIRVAMWDAVYNSILNSVKRSFELIIVSPFNLTPYLQTRSNVKLIRDFGSPCRCAMIGAEFAEGKMLYFTHADDGIFQEGALERQIEHLEAMGDDERNCVTMRFTEGKGFTDQPYNHNDASYRVANAYLMNKQHVPSEWYCFNIAIGYTSFYKKIGGLDCSLSQGTAIALADLAIRYYRAGGSVKMTSEYLLSYDHNQLDHGPVYLCQTYMDSPKLRAKYDHPLETYPINIPFDNWKQASRIWDLRFNIPEEWKNKLIEDETKGHAPPSAATVK